MPITIGDHVFEGPYLNSSDLMEDPGIFAVIVAKADRGTLIDVGESNNVRTCVESHTGRDRWHKFASSGRLCFAVLYTPGFNQNERSSIEKNIRVQYEQLESGTRGSGAKCRRSKKQESR